MPNGVAAIQWTDASSTASKSFKRIFTQQEDNKIYEFCWDSQSLKWTRGNDGYSITSVARRDTNIVAFKAETDQIILGCIGQDGYLWLKRFKVNNSGGDKLASVPPDPKLASVSETTSLAAVDISANGELHWCLFYQASDNSIQQIDYYDNQWHAATTICTGAIPFTPLAAVNTITPPGNPDTSATLILFFKDTDKDYLRLFAWQYGSRLDWPPSVFDSGSFIGWFQGASISTIPWPPEAGQDGALRLYLPDTSGAMMEMQLWYNSGSMADQSSVPSYNSSSMSLNAKPLAAITEIIAGSGERIITVYTGSESGKEISGFCCHDEVWTQIDPIQWDNLTT